VYSENDVGYSEIGIVTNSLDVKNYFINAKSLLNSFVLTMGPASTSMGNDGLPEINGSNTFFAKGLLSSVLFPHYDTLGHGVNGSSNLFNSNGSENNGDLKTSLLEFPKLVSGNWVLNVTRGNVASFHSLFKVVPSDGTGKHFVELINFQNQNASIILNPYSNTVINGYVDVKIDDRIFDYHLPIEIKLNKINTIALSMDNQSISDFFFKSQIQGIVDSFRNYKNAELLILNS
jgi:hypothetical protein